jgi:hypothetical protein
MWWQIEIETKTMPIELNIDLKHELEGFMIKIHNDFMLNSFE